MKRLVIILTIFVVGAALPIAGSRATADDASSADSGWTALFNGKDLTGWMIYPKGDGLKRIAIDWKVENGILIGSGPANHLFSQRGDYTNFHYRVEAMINEGGNSGQYFRTQFGPGFPKGYEAQINSTHRDPVKTGSLYPAFDPKLPAEVRKKIIINDKLHQPDEWFTQEVIALGNHIVIKVNGKTTVDFVDEKNTFPKGHFAIQQHDPGSMIKIRKIEVKELEAK